MGKATGSCGTHPDLARVLLCIVKEVFNGFPALIFTTDNNSDGTGYNTDGIKVFVFQLRYLQNP